MSLGLQAYGFPDENIDPELKKKPKYALEWCKAAWYSAEKFMPNNVFYKAKDRYDRVRMYMQGNQPVEDYKKAMRVDEETDSTMFPLDFSILKIVPNRRQVALGKLKQREYRPTAIPVDALAKDEMDEWFAQMKAKILMRQELEKTNPELLQSPEMAQEVNEPSDMEELEMEVDYGAKRKRSKEAEMAIRLAFFWNRVPEVLRPQIFENLFDHGWGIYRDDLGRDNKPKAKVVDLRRFITNFCRRPDMSDMKFAGEVYEVTLEEYEVMSGRKLSDDEKNEILAASKSIGLGPMIQSVNTPNSMSDDNHVVKLLDITWYSTDVYVFEDSVNKYGNPVVTMGGFNAQGEKYDRRLIRNVYQAKWVVGTDYIFDYGLMSDQKRTNENAASVTLPYHVMGVDVNEMQVVAMGEALIPLSDAIQVAWMKIQNIRNQMIPNGFDIDLDALEDAPIGKGGKVLNKRQVLDFFFQTGMLISRRRDISERNVNYKAIQYIENNYGQALAEAWNDFQQNVLLVREITGFNELTDGSTPNPKTLIPVAKMAYEATNNAMYGIVNAEKQLLFSLAESLVIRIQQAIRKGPVDGYIPALGKGTVEFIRLSAAISDRDYAVMLEDMPSEEQKMGIQEQLAVKQKEGMLTPADVLYIRSIDNYKQAEEVLAYRIKKREEQMHQREMQKITENHKGQQESNLQAVQLETEKLQAEYTLKKELISHEEDEKRKTIAIQEAEKRTTEMMKLAAKPAQKVGS